MALSSTLGFGHGTSIGVGRSNLVAAGIISLLTHTCIPVALNIDVHPKLHPKHVHPRHVHPKLHPKLHPKHMNISHHTIRDCTPNFATPAVQIPANPSQIHVFSQARYKLLGKG